jgi:hypothetical protein
MVSALAEAAKQRPNGYVVFTGDLLRHDFQSAFVSAGGAADRFPNFATKTITFVIRKLQRNFKVPVIIALGNNDSLDGDYAMPPNSPLFSTLENEIDLIAKSPDPSSRVTFEYGGYYRIPNPINPKLGELVLNTVLWSSNYSPGAEPLNILPGDAEMAWFSAQLQQARSRREKVSLVMHIPPGMDAYSSAKGKPTLMWKTSYQLQFNSLVEKYRDTLLTSFSGHTHMDDFRVYSDSKPFLAIHTTPAISPILGNNPGLSSFSFSEKDGQIVDISTFYLPLNQASPKWRPEYRFGAAYGTFAYTPGELASVAKKIRNRGGEFLAYQKYYDVSASPSPISPANLPAYSCTETSFSTDAFSQCIKSFGATSQTLLTTASRSRNRYSSHRSQSPSHPSISASP